MKKILLPLILILSFALNAQTVLRDKKYDFATATFPVSINLASNNGVYFFYGTKSLAGNIAVTVTGTPVDGMECTIIYDGSALTLNGHTVTVMGCTLTATQAKLKLVIISIYRTSVWDTRVFVDAKNVYWIGNIDLDTVSVVDNQTMKATGAGGIAIKPGGITNTYINSAAGIVFTKMAALSGHKVPILNGSGYLIASAIDTAKLYYLLNVSSDIQNQFNSKTGYADTVSLIESKHHAAATYNPLITAGTIYQYRRGDNTWQTLPLPVDTSSLASKDFVLNRTALMTGGGGTYTQSSSTTVVLTSAATDYYTFNVTSGNISVTLPSAADFPKGKTISIMKVGTSSTDTIKIAAYSGEGIRSYTSLSSPNFNMTGTVGQTIRLASNGTDSWTIIALGN